MSILFTVLTILLVCVSIFLILVVLMQRGSANGGLGPAMGGGMAESVLGAESSDVLSRTTRKTAIVFFVMVFGLYLAQLWIHEKHGKVEERTLPTFEDPAAPAANTGLEDLLNSADLDVSSEVAPPVADPAVVEDAADAAADESAKSE